MSKFHIGKQGPAPCRASKKPCPLGGSEIHFDSKDAAEKAFEETMKPVLLESKQKGEALTEELVYNGIDVYPREILIKLGKLLQEKPYATLSVMPAGSALYNTVIPGKEVHDYDFTVFTAPHPNLKKTKQTMQGELDVNFVALDRLQAIINRSTPFSEAIFAHRAGHSLNSSPENNNYSAMLNGFRASEMKYFDLLDDVMRSHRQQFTEPVTQDNPTEFRNFKHTVRWTIYQKRWGNSEKPFDPRLSEEERGLFLEALETGRIATLFE